MESDAAKQFLNLLKSFNSAVLVTNSSGNRLHARPMAIAQVEANGDLWFITGRDSAKAHEIQANREVQVVCQEGERKFICMNGSAQLVEDRVKIKDLWRPSFEVWFPKGPTDPDICLIFVRGQEAEFWDTSGTKGLRYIFSAAAAYAKGERPDLTDDQHGRVNLKIA